MKSSSLGPLLILLGIELFLGQVRNRATSLESAEVAMGRVSLGCLSPLRARSLPLPEPRKAIRAANPLRIHGWVGGWFAPLWAPCDLFPLPSCVQSSSCAAWIRPLGSIREEVGPDTEPGRFGAMGNSESAGLGSTSIWEANIWRWSKPFWDPMLGEFGALILEPILVGIESEVHWG